MGRWKQAVSCIILSFFFRKANGLDLKERHMPRPNSGHKGDLAADNTEQNEYTICQANGPKKKWAFKYLVNHRMVLASNTRTRSGASFSVCTFFEATQLKVKLCAHLSSTFFLFVFAFMCICMHTRLKYENGRPTKCEEPTHNH